MILNHLDNQCSESGSAFSKICYVYTKNVNDAMCVTFWVE
jgi:hypothetical protein